MVSSFDRSVDCFPEQMSRINKLYYFPTESFCPFHCHSFHFYFCFLFYNMQPCLLRSSEKSSTSALDLRKKSETDSNKKSNKQTTQNKLKYALQRYSRKKTPTVLKLQAHHINQSLKTKPVTINENKQPIKPERLPHT